MQSSKMRIKLYDPESKQLLGDRLVEQATEFRMGPKDVHKGPMSLEFNLESVEDVDSMVEYIKKLKGELPLAASSKPKDKSAKDIDKMLSDKEPLLDLYKTVVAKAKTQEELTVILREYGFKFLATQFILDYAKEGMITLKEKHHDYQWMVRQVKEAKDPANDKWDYRLVFGIRFMGERVPKVQVYLWGKYDTTLKLAWKEADDINFKKVHKVFIFPEWMDYTERRNWRKEHRKIIAAQEKGETIEPSKAYLKHKPYVQGI